MPQSVIRIRDSHADLKNWIESNDKKNIFVVCGQSALSLPVGMLFKELKKKDRFCVDFFNDFSPNPTYESIVKGVKFFNASKRDLIVAIGGGSAIDVAKCIKLFANSNPQINYLKQQNKSSNISFLAIPTTAGSGSEATRFAVLYYNGEKQSIANEGLIPNVVCLSPSCLETLPKNQKLASLLDAMCQAIESYWSVNSTEESKYYSDTALRLLWTNKDNYLIGEKDAALYVMEAAYLAGKAINITQTTAAHAFSYKITSKYGVPHGVAVAMCLTQIWPYMYEHSDKCIDVRGQNYLEHIFYDISNAMGYTDPSISIERFNDFVMKHVSYQVSNSLNQDDYSELVNSVNQQRLKNNPVLLEKSEINTLYYSILR